MRNWGDNDGDGIAEEFGSKYYVHGARRFLLRYFQREVPGVHPYLPAFLPSIGIIGSLRRRLG